MAKPRDDLLKRLVAANPQDFVNWLLPGAQFEGERSLELKSRTIEADIVYNVVLNEQPMILHADRCQWQELPPPQRPRCPDCQRALLSRAPHRRRLQKLLRF